MRYIDFVPRLERNFLGIQWSGPAAVTRASASGPASIAIRMQRYIV